MLAMMRSIWLSVEDPGKRGLPSSISPNIQPKLHMSTPLVYLHNAQEQDNVCYTSWATGVLGMIH